MAKRRRPEPEVTERHSAIIRGLAQKRDQCRELVDEVEDEIGVAVRAAFGEGVLVGPIKESLGRSGSRVYQIKFALRDQETRQHQDAAS
jgi:hypothetical protein